MSVWRDGRVLAGESAALAEDRGLLLGDGLFETIHVRDGAARHLAEHLARMLGSAEALGVVAPEGLADRVDAALAELHRVEGSPARAVLRVTLTRGQGRGLDLPPSGPGHLLVSLAPLPPRVPGRPADPVRGVVLDRPRVDPAGPLAGHKTLSALSAVTARRAARAAGADVALLRTVDGDLCEADAANVLLVCAGAVVTPSLDRGVLPGITRRRALGVLQEAGREVVERRIEAGDLAMTREVLLTSSLDGVRPLAALDGRALTAPGPVAAWLAACLGE